MGLPIGKLVVATNANDILARFWKSGTYEKVDSAAPPAAAGTVDSSGVKETLSPAMDILVSSNFERLLWYLAYEHSEGSSEEEKKRSACATLDAWMGKVKSNGRVSIPVEALESARRDFLAERVGDEEVSTPHELDFFHSEPGSVDHQDDQSGFQ